MISINAILVLQVVHLLILVFILNRLMFQPILRLITERAAFIEKSRNEIIEFERETERLKKEYLSRENKARRTASREGQQLKSMGLTEVEELIESSQKKVVSIRGDAEKAAEDQRKANQPLLGDEAAVLSDEIVERVIGRRVAL